MEIARPASVPEPVWSLFLGHGQPRRVEAGELLWEPGEQRDDAAYLVLRGLVRLYHPSRKGLAVTLLVAGPGGLVGHHPELEHRPYSTGAEALCTGTLLTLPSNLTARWLSEPNEAGRAFTTWLREDLARQLRSTYARLELDHEAADAKVARALLALDRQALLDRLSRQQLADVSNLTLETVVRTLTAFVRRGVLRSGRFTALSSEERTSLSEVLVPLEPEEVPYS